jgi:hypothetical protein
VSDHDQVDYSRASRLRVVLASQAAEIADLAAAMVPACADSEVEHGAFIQSARQIAVQARDLLTTAIAWERQLGASWEAVGQELGVTCQSAREWHATAVARLEDAVTVAWLLAGDCGGPGSPAQRMPDETARQLDQWPVRQFLRLCRTNSQDWVRPVSGHLSAMDTLEHATMITAAADILAVAQADRGDDDPYVRQLETGLARRRVGLYERILAEEAFIPGRRSDIGLLRDLLAAARAHLAQLEHEESL